MKALLLSLAGILLFASLSFAFEWGNSSGSIYDWRNGNNYITSKSPSGYTEINGFNSRTGKTWSTTIAPNGNMRGRNKNGNYWIYDSGTGYYINPGTGTTCIGKGYARRCW